jgi:lipopolysaccharide assembly protein A
MIRLILVFILLALSLSFFLQNREPVITLRYFFGLKTAETQVYIPILSAFVIGLLVSSILLFPAWVRGRIELRRKTKQLQEAEAELEQLREAERGTESDHAAPLAGDDEPPA